MTRRKGEDNGNSKKKLEITLCGKLALKEAMHLS
jgi:hypothetical protein